MSRMPNRFAEGLCFYFDARLAKHPVGQPPQPRKRSLRVHLSF